MANLNTTYMGVDLQTPIVIGASNMVLKEETLRQLQENGAGAVVFKSLFEEQLHLEELEMDEVTKEMDNRHAEMIDPFHDIKYGGPKEYLFQLKKAREILDIPLFASLNAIYKDSWVTFAKQIAETGVNGIELNFYAVPLNFDKSSQEIEDEQIEILKSVIDAVDIPVYVKLSPYYANVLNLIKRMDDAGSKGFILFNRLFEPQIDVETEAHVVHMELSNENQNRLGLRYSGLLYDNIKGSIISSGGIYHGNDVVKMMLSGADAVQVVSAVYKHKPQHIAKMLKEIDDWMDAHNYSSLDDFRGKLSQKYVKDSRIYKRAQYVGLLLRADSVFKKYPMP
ncbi:MAG: dihydroorotate dehydrogenase-like protein [Bacteroidales bacterium]|jgi:dihydroorotate dehydrogenase (fumarate)|nr:dihydroorotate dehydrogenase-like protein [Bacteroidales bacterium]